MKCKGTGCSGNKKGDGDKAGEMPKIPEFKPPEKKPSEEKPCQPGATPPPPPPPANFGTSTSSTTPGGGVTNPTRPDPCATSGSNWLGFETQNPLTGLYNNIFGESTGGTDDGNIFSDITDNILDTFGFGDNTSPPPPPPPTSPGGNTGGTASTTTTGGKGTTGSGTDSGVVMEEQVIEGSGGITVITKGFDKLTNTGIAGFFGRLFTAKDQKERALQSQSFFGRLCSARPWQSSLVLRVFSSRFFDSLCERKGISSTVTTGNDTTTDQVVGRAKLTCPTRAQQGKEIKIEWSCYGSQSAGVGFNTNGKAAGTVSVVAQKTTQYSLRCANTGRASCTVAVEEPRAEIVAHPARVQLNERARIFWAAEGVTDCSVTGPGVSEQGVRGAATTLAILDATTFTIVCTTPEGAQVRDSVTVEVGA